MHEFTRILTAVFDALLSPFGTHRLAALVVLSVVSGALLTILFRSVSKQDAIRRSRALFQARILELRLYPDDALLIARAFGGAMKAQGTYLRAALLPIVVVAVVALPLFIQTEQRFAHAALEPGSRTLVTARVAPIELARSGTPTLTADAGVSIDDRPLRVSATGEVVWPVRVTESGRHQLALSTDRGSYALPIEATPSTRVIGTHRETSPSDGLIHAGLPALPRGGSVASLRVAYPEARYRVFGFNMGWLTVFLVGTLLGAVIPARLLRIQL